MVAFLVLHVFRVYSNWRVQEAQRTDLVDGYRPGCAHGLLWCDGLLVALYDQTGYWAIRIVTGVPDALPSRGTSSRHSLAWRCFGWSGHLE